MSSNFLHKSTNSVQTSFGSSRDQHLRKCSGGLGPFPFNVERWTGKNLPNTFRLRARDRGALFIRDRVLLVNYAPWEKKTLFCVICSSSGQKGKQFRHSRFSCFCFRKRDFPFFLSLTFSWENHYGLGKLPGLFANSSYFIIYGDMNGIN